jgi:hypothetical protein
MHWQQQNGFPGIGLESHGSLAIHGSSARPTPLRAPLPLPEDPFAGHYGFDPSRSSGPPQPVAQPSARLELPAAPQADPAQHPIAYIAALMEVFSK